MNKHEAEAYGQRAGFAAVMNCEVSDTDQREVSCECEDGQLCADCLSSAAWEAEQNSRQYSPFEFLAHDINECEDRADGLWDAYDKGVDKGIKKGLRNRLARA